MTGIYIKHYATKTPDLSKIRFVKKFNEYDLTQLGHYMSDDRIMSDVIESYKNYGNNKQCIVFAVNRSHSKELVNRFLNEGISAKYIDSKTIAKDRSLIINEFKNKEIQVLVNVKIFTEGFDCPDITVVQLVRPTKSLALYLQMVGRAIRPCEGKDKAIIIDNAGLWKTHGLIIKERKWTLNGAINSNNTRAVKNPDGFITEKNDVEIIEIKGLEMQDIAPRFPLEPKVIYKHADIALDCYPREIFSPVPNESLFSYLRRVVEHVHYTQTIYKYPVKKAKIYRIEYEFKKLKKLNADSELYSMNKGFLGFYLDTVFFDITDFTQITISEFNNEYYQNAKNLKDLKFCFSSQMKKAKQTKKAEDERVKEICKENGIGLTTDDNLKKEKMFRVLYNKLKSHN